MSEAVFHGHTSPAIQPGGWLEGHRIRKARKPFRCTYWWGDGSTHPEGKRGRCNAPVEAGDLYLEGEPNDEAGGFGSDRYCVRCGEIVPAKDGAQ